MLLLDYKRVDERTKHNNVNIGMLFDNSVITPCSVNPNINVIIEVKTKLLTNGMDMYMGVEVLWLLYAGTLA